MHNILKSNLSVLTSFVDFLIGLGQALMLLILVVLLMVGGWIARAQTAEEGLVVAQVVINDQATEIGGLIDELKDARGNLGGMQTRVEDLEGQLGESLSTIDGLSTALGAATAKLPRGRVDLVLVLDVSMSMADARDQLASASVGIAEVISSVAEELNVGVVAYRDTVVTRRPLSRVVSPDEDGGRSVAELEGFLGGLACATGNANHPLALREAFGMTNAAGGGEARQIIVVLSDAGVEEAAQCLGRPAGQVEKALFAATAAWSSRPGCDRRLVSYFAGDAKLPSKSFFEAMAAAIPHGVFAADQFSILRTLTGVALAPKQ